MTGTAADHDRYAGRSRGRPLFGALLLAAGAVWLFNQTHLLHLSAEALLSVLLIAIGFSLVLTGRRRRGRGPVILGGIVTLVLLTSSPNVHNWMPAGTMRDLAFRPTSLAGVQGRYEQGLGNLNVDLTALPRQSGTQSVDANVGFGNLTVEVPDWLGVRLDAHDGMGGITINGQQIGSGFGSRESWSTPNYDAAPEKIVLHLRVGHGNIELDTAPAGPASGAAPEVSSSTAASSSGSGGARQ